MNIKDFETWFVRICEDFGSEFFLMHPVTSFFKNIWRTEVLFVGPLIPLFWTSGDFNPGFQSQGGSLPCVLSHLCTTDSSDSTLVQHLPTSWQPVWQAVCIPNMHTAEVGCWDSNGRSLAQQTRYAVSHRDRLTLWRSCEIWSFCRIKNLFSLFFHHFVLL